LLGWQATQNDLPEFRGWAPDLVAGEGKLFNFAEQCPYLGFTPKGNCTPDLTFSPPSG